MKSWFSGLLTVVSCPRNEEQSHETEQPLLHNQPASYSYFPLPPLIQSFFDLTGLIRQVFNSLNSPQTNLFSNNAEEGITETVLFHLNYNSQNSIALVGRQPHPPVFCLIVLKSLCNVSRQNKFKFNSKRQSKRIPKGTV